MNKVVVINRNTKVFLYNKPTNMSCSFPRLTEFIETSGIPEYDLAVGNLFLFINKKHTYMKVLFKSNGGFCILAKKLEHGKFNIDASKPGISVQELDKLLNTVTKKMLKAK